jgi:hypothetical protein
LCRLRNVASSLSFYMVLFAFPFCGLLSQQPPQTKAIEAEYPTTKTDWNCDATQFIPGSLAALATIRRVLLPPSQFVSSSLSNSQDRLYRRDFLRWASFIMSSNMLPKDICEHLVEVKGKRLSSPAGIFYEKLPASTRPKADGFIVKYRQGSTLIQIQDVACQLSILASDPTILAESQSKADRLSYARKIMKLLLRQNFCVYPNGKDRVVCPSNEERFLAFSWRWDHESENEDLLWKCRAFPSTYVLTYELLSQVITDGHICIMVFNKSCVGPGAVDAPRESRFSELALFHQMSKEEWNAFRKDTLRELQQRQNQQTHPKSQP